MASVSIGDALLGYSVSNVTDTTIILALPGKRNLTFGKKQFSEDVLSLLRQDGHWVPAETH